MNREQLKQHIPYNIAVLSNTIKQTTSDVFVKGTGMSPREWRVLAIVGLYQPISSSQIAKRTGMDKATVTRSTNCLLDTSYINKYQNPNDGRSTLIKLTEEGQQKFEQLAPKMLASGNEYRKALSDGETLMLLELLGKLQSHAESLLKNPES